MTQIWLQNCYVRGPELTFLSTQDASTAVLLEESLIIGQYQPLVHLQGREEDVFHWRCLRSTLITGQVGLRWDAAKARKESPQIHCWVLDSILSRNDPSAPLGNLLQAPEDADLSRLRWKVSNSVYAGWKKLLACGSRAIAGNDLDAWRRQWLYSSGDRLVVESWPSNPLARPEEVPARAYLPRASAPVAFAALSGSGAIGTPIG